MLGGNRLSLTIRNNKALYGSYMPFIKNGGLFIPTDKEFKLGQELFILLTLSTGKGRETLPIAGKVVWINPRGALGSRPPGIGVQFSELDKGATRSKIETQLAAQLSSEQPTQTM